PTAIGAGAAASWPGARGPTLGPGAAGISPGWPTYAMTCCTGTSCPSGTTIWSSTPLTGDSTSFSALSVSTVNSGSSLLTGSPTFFSQRVMTPDSMVRPSV